MSELTQLCLYHPSSVAIVDDNKSFLTTLTLELDAKLSYVTFSEPRLALDFIEKNYTKDPEKLFFEDYEADSFGLKSMQQDLKIDFSSLYKKIYNPKRFVEPSAVIVDYSMPKINGYEFCKQLQFTSIKKLMLTSEADDKLAINLFNQGILNKFLLKSKIDSSDIINNMIAELQNCYFREKSKTIFEVLKNQSHFHLSDSSVNAVFAEICQEYNIVEYYLITSNGSYLLMSYEGKPYYFIVIDENELSDYQEIANDQRASSFILKSLEGGKKIPYFANYTELMNATGNSWEPYLYPAKKIEGNKIYYFALVTDNILKLKLNKILSYKSYLLEVWPPA